MPKKTSLDDNAEIYKVKEAVSEKEKLRNMNTKEKLGYLWEYYKLHALLFIIVIAAIVFIVNRILAPNIETKLYAVLVNNPFEEQVLEDFKQDLSEHFQINPETEEIFIHTGIYADSPEEPSLQQAILTYVTVGDLDVIIAPESLFKPFCENGFFDKLIQQLPADLYNSLTDQLYTSSTSEYPQSNAYGIYVADTDLFKNHSAQTREPYVLGIVYNSKYKENAVEFIRYLFQ